MIGGMSRLSIRAFTSTQDGTCLDNRISFREISAHRSRPLNLLRYGVVYLHLISRPVGPLLSVGCIPRQGFSSEDIATLQPSFEAITTMPICIEHDSFQA